MFLVEGFVFSLFIVDWGRWVGEGDGGFWYGDEDEELGGRWEVD